MYVNTLLHCHFCIQILTHHFLLCKVSHHTINKCRLIIPYLISLPSFVSTYRLFKAAMFLPDPAACMVSAALLSQSGLCLELLLLSLCFGMHHYACFVPSACSGSAHLE